MNKTNFSDSILEKASAVVTAKIKDENGISLGLSGTGVTSLTLSLYSMSDPSFPIINNRNIQNVLNTNNVTFDSSGNLTWIIQPLDNVILDNELEEETHRAIFEWVYASGTKIGKHILDLKIINLERIT